MNEMAKRLYTGKCTNCKYRDVVNKKWWGHVAVVCTFNSPLGKELLGTENIPSWCPNGGVPATEGVPDSIKEIDCKKCKWYRKVEFWLWGQGDTKIQHIEYTDGDACTVQCDDDDPVIVNLNHIGGGCELFTRKDDAN